MVRNEAESYFASALDSWAAFADDILVLDDGSTDGTLEIATEHPATIVVPRISSGSWGNESPTRQQLFDEALAHTAEGDYIFWLDADMVPLRDPRELLQTGCDQFYFPLFDLWGRQNERLLYRCDGAWQAHLAPRLWMIQRPPAGFVPQWNPRGVHCGHLPLNLPKGHYALLPQEFGILHYAYLDEADRLRKSRSYLQLDGQLSETEWRHASSITDPSPRLKTLEFKPKWDLRKSSAPTAAVAPDPSDSSAVSSAAF